MVKDEPYDMHQMAMVGERRAPPQTSEMKATGVQDSGKLYMSMFNQTIRQQRWSFQRNKLTKALKLRLPAMFSNS